jgi:iron(III) transport system substrate-binding protein
VKYYDKRYYDSEGLHVTTRILISPIAYNTNLVKKEDAPKSFKDLLDPKWKGKLVKAHPAYSGTIMNSTFEVARDLGWDYFVKLAAQNVMQVQSATDTPKRISVGERAVMVDGAGYLVIRYKEAGQPVEIVYPEEGTPLATGQASLQGA